MEFLFSENLLLELCLFRSAGQPKTENTIALITLAFTVLIESPITRTRRCFARDKRWFHAKNAKEPQNQKEPNTQDQDKQLYFVSLLNFNIVCVTIFVGVNDNMKTILKECPNGDGRLKA